MSNRQLNKALAKTVALWLSFLTLFFCVPGTAYAAIAYMGSSVSNCVSQIGSFVTDRLYNLTTHLIGR